MAFGLFAEGDLFFEFGGIAEDEAPIADQFGDEEAGGAIGEEAEEEAAGGIGSGEGFEGGGAETGEDDGIGEDLPAVHGEGGREHWDDEDDAEGDVLDGAVEDGDGDEEEGRGKEEHPLRGVDEEFEDGTGWGGFPHDY